METGICKIPLSLTFRSIQTFPLSSFKSERVETKEEEGRGRSDGQGTIKGGIGEEMEEVLWKEIEKKNVIEVNREAKRRKKNKGRGDMRKEESDKEEEEGGEEILRRRENTIWEGSDEENFQNRYDDRNISSRLSSMLYFSQRNNFLNEKIMKFNEKKNEETKKYDELPSIECAKETYKTNFSIDITLEKDEMFIKQSNALVEMLFMNKITEINKLLLGISFPS